MPSIEFSDEVNDTLRKGGWQAGNWDMARARDWAETIEAFTGADGHRHTVFTAAVEVWAEYGGLDVEIGGPGEELARTGFRIDPLAGLRLPRTFTDFGRALGVPVAPLGEEAGGQALLAIDEKRRVHSLDHTGEWQLGADIIEAISTLVEGRRPQRLVLAAAP